MFLFGAKMELNGFIDFDKMLYLQGKMWYRYQKLYRNLMFERRKYLKELFNNFQISDIADDGATFFCVILVRKWGEMLFCAILCSIFAVACV